MLLFMATASASSSGTVSNPLISLSYLNGRFTASLKTEISNTHDAAAAGAVAKLDDIHGKYLNYSFTPRFTRVSLLSGDMVTLKTGGSFILLSGAATLTTVNGTVINVSTGSEVNAGTKLNLNHRYFCVENTTATISVNASSAGQVDGHYILESAVPNKPHPVFRDVWESDWFYAAVDFVYNRTLFAGTSPNTFSPSASMTRAMFVTVLYRLEGEPAVTSGGQFSDVQNSSAYYYSAVTWASANGIVLGYSNGNFGPNDSVTREQIATIICRYAEYKNRDMSSSGVILNSFTDRENISGFALIAMRWAVTHGIINGSGGKLLPKNSASRAEVAQIINNYVKIMN